MAELTRGGIILDVGYTARHHCYIYNTLQMKRSHNEVIPYDRVLSACIIRAGFYRDETINFPLS